MGASGNARTISASPWTVVLQGTPLRYEDATRLDKLEYAIRIGGSSVDRYLSQPEVIEGLSSALAEAAGSLTNTDSLIRAGKLVTAVADFITAKDRAVVYDQFVSGLGVKFFTPFVTVLHHEKELSSWYLDALGKLLGHKRLASFAKSAGAAEKVAEQKRQYVTSVCTVLSIIAEESMRAHLEEDDQDKMPTATPPTTPSMISPMTSVSSIVPPSSLSSAASSLGYIPTVAGISASIPSTAYSSTEDEQLGRILSGLAMFLSNDHNRYIFASTQSNLASGSKAPAILAALLDKDVGLPVQVYYQTVFCFWLLSFVNHQDGDDEIMYGVSVALEQAAVPRRLTNVLREVWAEKVVRISLATLRNMLNMSVNLRKEMVGAGLVNALQSLCFRRWNDEDIREDLGVLAEALESELASMSNFDVYRAEVLSGALEWTPAHRDEMFWRENVEKLDRNQQEVLRCLVRLLHESTNETVLAVVCNDLAQFIKFHPRGRAIAQSLGVKARLMELMIAGEGDVRRYALNCVQVLMIRWKSQES